MIFIMNSCTLQTENLRSLIWEWGVLIYTDPTTMFLMFFMQSVKVVKTSMFRGFTKKATASCLCFMTSRSRIGRKNHSLIMIHV